MAENRELALVLKLVADQFQSELKKQQGALASFNSFISDWKTQLVGAGTALFAIAKSTANYGEEALKTAGRLGVTVETVTALSHAANLADVSRETLERGMKSLATAAVQAATNTGDGAKVFNQLGISATDAAGKVKPLDQLFFEFQDRLKGVKNGAEFVDLGVKAFGKSFLELAPLIRQGSAETKALMADAEKLGLVMSKEDAEAANKFNDELKILMATLRGISITVGKELIPIITDLMSLLKSDAGTFFFKGLSMQATLFTTLVKEAAANVEFLLGKLSFEELKTKVKGIEAGAEAKLMLLQNPEAEKFLGDSKPQPGPAGGGETGVVTDQEKLGKAKLEMFQISLRAEEIATAQRNKNAAAEEAAYRHMIDFKIQEEENEKTRQEQLGKQIVAQTSLEVKVREEALAQERSDLVASARARVEYDTQVGASTEERLRHQLELVSAEMEKELAVVGLSERQKETIVINAMTRISQANDQASENVIEGWARGMRRYVQDTKTGFGLGADLARRTAQGMEQGLTTFFFDAMNNKIQTFKDAMKSMFNFVKQIAAQIISQLITMLALKAAMAAFGGGAGAGVPTGVDFGTVFRNKGGMIPQYFDIGGRVLGDGNRDTVHAILTPGEGVLSRRGMAALDQLNQGNAGAGATPTNITVNVVGTGRTDAPQVNYRRQMEGLIVDVIFKNPDLRSMLFSGR